MFVQIIEGRTKRGVEMQHAGTRWLDELLPGATGFVGVTAGVTSDGRGISVVLFDSPESARANSDRPEQTAFWNEMSAFYDSEPVFTESTDTETFLGGISPDATFVQVMKTVGADRVRTKELDNHLEKFATLRPDLLGILRVWTTSDTSYELAYFTDEAAARAGESQEMPPEMTTVMAEFADVMANTEFFDLENPTVR